MTHRLAVFGDSHYACVKNAVDQGRVDLPAQLDLEFWGHVGRRFRRLGFVDGAITPDDPYTAARFAKFSTRKRDKLPIGAFDTVFFMGCRIRSFPAFAKLIRGERAGACFSKALRRRLIKGSLNSDMHYKIAKAAAAVGGTRIIVLPVSFPTWAEDLVGDRNDRFPFADTTSAEELDMMWDIMECVMKEDGITLIRQPSETVVEGLYTSPTFGVDGFAEKNDYAHRNATFGAIAFERVLQELSRAEPTSNTFDRQPVATMDN